MTPVVERLDSIQYDGTNEAAVAAVIPQYTFISEDANGLAFQSGFGSWFCPPGGWIVYSVRFLQVIEQWNDTASYEEARRELVQAGQVEELQEQIEGVVTALQGALLAVGAETANFGVGNTTVPVPIKPAQPDANYAAEAELFGGLNLGALSVTSVTPVDGDTVDVVVNNSGLLALGASLLVTVKAAS